MNFRSLTIYSENLDGMYSFYTDRLGLTPLNPGPVTASFRIGKTELIIERRKQATPYHFAVNIPSGSEKQALRWIKRRVPVCTINGNDIQDFKSWDAKSIYFYDIDKNIVEFISRRKLGYPPVGEFGPDSFREISEIGLAVDSVRPFYNQLRKKIGLSLFDGDLEKFSAIGDEYGLFICINYHSKRWFPVNDQAFASEFELLAAEGNITYKITYHHEHLTVDRIYE